MEVTDVNGSDPAYKNLTVRDTIAIAALQGFLASGRVHMGPMELAKSSYLYADALLYERNKTNQTQKETGN